ncbi:MAG: DUF362 domain-containing protein, partial [Chloroflexi bacterium]|nr:DUF362 domain-containing protein [Chloroflexota bacterium]
TDPLDGAWERLTRARRITVKFNQARVAERRHMFEGNLRELVDGRVARAVLRLLRERTDAEIVCTEISNDALWLGCPVEDTVTLMPVLKEFGVPFINGNVPPHRVCPVPGGGLMFDQYLLPASAVETDAFVSVQKMKSHVSMGITLALKNLFGLPPTEPYGRARQYFHHFIRLPYVLVDLGRIVQPTLSVIDALVGQSEREWNGEGRVADTLIAGDQVIATDACGTHLMGHDPLGDWPSPPFVRDRNALRIAHETGFGTADLRGIDLASEVAAPVAAFHTLETDPFETVLAWRRSTCEQALYYRDNRQWFVDRHPGEYILLQDGEVRWHSRDSALEGSRRDLAGANKLSAMWLKLVDPDEAEGEHYAVYEQVLADMRAAYG